MDNLTELGWRTYFAAQVGEADAGAIPARVLAVHRDRVDLAGEGVPASLPLTAAIANAGIAVGDWVLVANRGERLSRVLQRAGAFRRKAAGDQAVFQYLAANVDTVFVVTSANRDFNPARLERYLALAHDAGAWPVVVITKADCVDTVDEYVSAARKLATGLVVEAIDARDPAAAACLAPWAGLGQTVALLGSSGVGKSTLVNSLSAAGQATQAVREDDQRGRHTTTARSMHRLPAGGWLIDTPGMRELQLADVAAALDDVFAEIRAMAGDCRFGDCTHDNEPGCAVRAAIDAGRLDAGRLERYRKLRAEDRRNAATVAERHRRDREFGRLYRSVMKEKRRRRDGEH